MWHRKKYRPNVGLMIVNNQGLVWLGERAEHRRHPHSLQMPQGGIDLGETPEQAAYRELREETGLTRDKVKLLSVSKKWRSYNFPKPLQYGETLYHGQSQKWFLFLFNGVDQDFDLKTHPEEIEFSDFHWKDCQATIDCVMPLKQKIYKKVIHEFAPVLKELKKSNPF